MAKAYFRARKPSQRTVLGQMAVQKFTCDYRLLGNYATTDNFNLIALADLADTLLETVCLVSIEVEPPFAPT